MFTLVHGIRSLALKAKLSERNTYRRIEILKQKEILSPTLASDIRESLAYLQSLQLKYGLIKAQQGKLLDYGIELAQLTTLERDLLKDTLTVVKRFKQTIAHQFKLNTL
ncbi:putative nucleotidyltransferase substrate binding domain-containing protein [Deefgea sp. CFH1-16]|uniref:putative nucleotidyltransferase substrate binding domain-containing protein n=1 Tax=Deefgea sp. CFH1-16 TaxID=2675457 RepID=UPI001D8B357C|nr:putative nucleotidyltransferase substrate binding domain-containing protein [Deefgea sp. CFH1-16]MBM5573765.1 signal transduction protein [Deefgea sp. CFH1-16]